MERTISRSWTNPSFFLQNLCGRVDFPHKLTSPKTTPPFAEYPSAHSSYSGASGEVLRSFFGNDVFIANATVIPAGTSRTEPKRVSGETGYIAGVTDVPNSGPNTVGYVPAQVLCVYQRKLTQRIILFNSVLGLKLLKAQEYLDSMEDSTSCQET